MDLDKLAAEKILEKVPQKAAVKLNENGVTGHVYAFKDLDGVKNCLIEKFDVEEDKVVFADPGILYEGVGEDVGSPISNKHMDGKDKAELNKKCQLCTKICKNPLRKSKIRLKNYFRRSKILIL